MQQQLESRGYHCSLACSVAEAEAILRGSSFHLVLTVFPVRQMVPLLQDLGLSNCSVFYCCPVERGYWWLPVFRDGQECFGAPALRSHDFFSVIRQTVNAHSAVPKSETTRGLAA